MSDRVVMPPVRGCQCAFCATRRWELSKAATIESELHGIAIRANRELVIRWNAA